MIIAFTGAGISRESGIATFMEQPDVRDRLYRSYATDYPESYNETIKQLHDVVSHAGPNDAHYALSDYNIPVITMNIDGLHEACGTDTMTLHGTLPSEDELSHANTLWNKPVLYGDPAPNYHKAMQKIDKLGSDDILLVIGASRHTAIAVEIRELAHSNDVEIIEIQENAVIEVRETLLNLQEKGRL